MKVIFLDIDGVLNDRWTWSAMRGVDALKPECVVRFAALLQRTGAWVVLSSTWRIAYPLPAIRQALHAVGWPDPKLRWFGETPDLSSAARGREIAQWLTAHPEVLRYAILDDNEVGGEVENYLVRTDEACGLTDEDCALVEALLR